MATIPDEDEKPQPTGERIARALASPVTQRPPGAVLLTAAAILGSLAPDPWGAIVAGISVLVAFELAKRR
jgi:hypothetical protein